jgi:hypothetical protein
LDNTPIAIRKKKRNKNQFNPLEDDIEREPSISTNLGGLLHNTRNIIKTDLYPSIRNPGVEASIQPADKQYINSNFVKEGEITYLFYISRKRNLLHLCPHLIYYHPVQN